MNRRDEEMSAERLFCASEAVLAAVHELAAGSHGPCPYPPDLLDNPRRPACLHDFTRSEVVQATTFLLRLGFVRPVG